MTRETNTGETTDGADGSTTDQHNQIDQFGDHYSYDTTYMHELLEHSPKGYQAFQDFMPMGQVRESLPIDAYWVAKLVSMQTEDCGACLQLNVTMALEAGVERDVVAATIAGGNDLEPRLQQVCTFASQITPDGMIDADLRSAMDLEYSKEELLEFGLAIASTKVYPAIKRALGYAKSCSLITITVPE